jgi:hypothetical protein
MTPGQVSVTGAEGRAAHAGFIVAGPDAAPAG